MAHFVRDGFDFYNAISDASNLWNTINATTLSTTTRFSRGRALTLGNFNSADALVKTGGSNAGTWFCLFSMMQTTAIGTAPAGNGMSIQFRDVATIQCAIRWAGDGIIRVYRGTAEAGTLVATFGATGTEAFTANSFDHWAVKVIIHGSAGEVHIRKNGATSDTYSITGLDLTSTANDFANAVAVRSQSGSFLPIQIMEDLWFYTGSGAAPNDWLGDVCALQMMPTFDTAVLSFTRSSTGSLSTGNTANGFTISVSANFVYTTDVSVATQGGTFTTATAEFNAGFTGHAKIALYKADGGGIGGVSESEPGTLVAVSNEITNPTTGANVFTFATGPIPFMKGLTYFWAVITDAACVFRRAQFTGGRISINSITYASGFPSSLSRLTQANANSMLTIYATLTANNAGCVNDDSQDSTTTYVSAAPYEARDLYQIDQMVITPSSVVGVSIKSRALRAESAQKNFKITGRSGTTDFDSAEFALTTTFGGFDHIQDTDPNTGAAWTIAAVNALQVGPKGSGDTTLFIPSSNLALSRFAPT
jgi:hypothetical protein